MQHYGKHLYGHWLLAGLLYGSLTLLSFIPSLGADTTPSPAPPTAPVEYEAASGTLSGPIKVFDDYAASGGKAVGNFEMAGSSLTFANIDGGAGGYMTLAVTYANGASEDSPVNVIVNGTTTTLNLKPTKGSSGGGNYQVASCDIELSPGAANTIVLSLDRCPLHVR